MFLALFQAACGGAGDQAAPTADELRAAQAGTQAVGDGGSGFGPSPSQASTLRDASATPPATLHASVGAGGYDGLLMCLDKALSAGRALTAEAATSLDAALFGKVSANVGLDVGGADGKGAMSTASGGDGAGGAIRALAADSNAVTTLPLVFSAADCTFGDAALSGNELVRLYASGRVQVVADLSWKRASGEVLRVTSFDPTRPTYDLAGAVSAGIRTVTVLLNEHRVKTAADGVAKLDVATQTADGIGLTVVETVSAVANPGGVSDAQPTGPLAQVSARTITKGQIQTTHALAKFTATQTFDGLAFDLSGACVCPISGTFTQDVVADDQSRTARHAYTFTECGKATVDSTVKTKAGEVTGRVTVVFEDCAG